MDVILIGAGQRDPSEVATLLDEAVAVAPVSYLEQADELLPRRRRVDSCRLCGEIDTLTREHIPPKRAGNIATMPTETLRQKLAGRGAIDAPGGQVVQGGIWGYTLCESCNSFTGSEYGAEYQGWAIRAVLMLRQSPELHPRVLDENPEPIAVTGRFGGPNDGGVAPGAMARQILSCMCSLSNSWNLAAVSPVVRRIVLDKSTEPLPPGVTLWMELFAGPNSRMSGPAVVSDQPGRWAWIMELAHPPLVFIMVLASNHDPEYGMAMHPFVLEAPSRRLSLTGTWQVAFGQSPLPGDFRSAAAIERDRL